MRIGLALSGGAVRGLAHIGVMQALAAADIPIDCVAGCSAGSILGAMYCAGMSLNQIQSYVPHVTWRRIANLARSKEGLLDFEKLERLMIMLLGDIRFRDLKIPFAVTVMDTATGERLIIHEGRLAPAIRASCSIPGFVTPAEVDGRLLADGGVVDNLPVDGALALGADYVIGVDVFEPNYLREWGLLGKGVTVIETLVRNAGGGIQQADFLISPKTAGRTYVHFSRHKELISLGRQAAQESLPALKQSIAAKRASS
ncbi:MAG: patatin-like phospholipase family protein [Chloroflexota bacterium]